MIKRNGFGRICMGIATLLFLLGNASVASAAQVKTMKNAVICVDGFSAGMDKEGEMLLKRSGKLMVPLDFVCRVLSLEYTINEQNTEVHLSYDGHEYILSAGKSYLMADGEKKEIAVKSRKIQGTLYVSYKALRLMGLKVRYFKRSAKTKELGYEGPVLAVNTDGTKIGLSECSMHSEAVTFAASKDTNELVLVKCTGGSRAEVSFHKKQKNGKWKRVCKSKGYIGLNGYGKEREGDKKTPLGTFGLSKAFGICDNPGTSMDYTKVNEYHYWCGDYGKPYFNQLVDVRDLGVSSVPGEHLIEYQGYYNYCLFIDYNAEGEYEKGSCIFLHCSAGAKGTSGCVAVSEKMMIKILKKIHDGAKIVIYT